MEHLPLILGLITIGSTIISIGISVGISQTKMKMFESQLEENNKITHANEQKIAVRDEEMKVIHKQIEERQVEEGKVQKEQKRSGL